jgi:hypothetical protein
MTRQAFGKESMSHTGKVQTHKRELLELWWGLEIQSHAENISGN